MAKIVGNEIRPGYVIEHDGGLWVAVKTNTVKPGKGGAYNQVELKNLINGTNSTSASVPPRRWNRFAWT
jgi:elongation factor P